MNADPNPTGTSPVHPVSMFSSRWFRITLATLVLFATILITTPLLIERLAEQWLEQHGGEQVEVQNVDFNPFTGILRLENVSVQVEDRTPLSFATAELNLAWLPLFHRHIRVQSVELTGFRMLVRNEDVLRIGGITLPVTGPDSSGDPPANEPVHWAAGIDRLGLNDFTLLYQDRRINSTVYIDSLQLDNLTQWTPEQAANLDFRGRINDAALTLKAKLAPFSATPAYTGSLSLQDLQLSDFESLARPALEKLAGLVSLDGDFSIEQQGEALHVRHQGTLLVKAAGVSHPDARVANHSLAWTGTTSASIPLDSTATLQLENQGKLDIGQLTLELPARHMEARQNQLVLDGNFAFSNPASGPAFRLQADIDILQPDLESPGKKMDIVSADRLRIRQLELDEQPRFKAGQITADDLNIGRSTDTSGHEDPAFYRAGHLLISNVAYGEGAASIDAIHEKDVHVLYHRDREGNWRVNTLLSVLLGEEKEPASGSGEEAAGGTSENAVSAGTQNRLRIGRIDFTNGSTMTILDEAVKPPFKETVTFSKLSLDNLDSGKPDQASTLKADGKLGKHTRLSAGGIVKPFLQPPGLDLKGQLYAMDLPRLSSYTRDSLGVLLDSGSLDADLDIKSEKNVTKGKAVLKLHQLELISVDSKDSLQSSIPVPLNVALDTLRDKNNTIELEIPFEGDASNPEFDASDAIRQAFATGLKKGAASYLKYALQPYGTLILAAEYAGKAVTRVRLKSIDFESGKSDLDDSDRDYLAKVANVLHDRPRLAIKLCGVAVSQDAIYFQQQANAGKQKKTDRETPSREPVIDTGKLTELADQRAARVKNYLVDKFKVPADHLVGCRSRIETEKPEASARTELLI